LHCRDRPNTARSLSTGGPFLLGCPGCSWGTGGTIPGTLRT
jgi:hypothetical protein